MKMNSLTILLVVLAGVSMVLAQQCPVGCDNPKTTDECLLCLEQGYSDIVLNRPLGQYHRKLLGKDVNQLEKGSWRQWTDDRCWIHLKGVNKKDDCKRIGKAIFGYDKCYGFSDTEWYPMKKTCWVKFRKNN